MGGYYLAFSGGSDWRVFEILADLNVGEVLGDLKLLLVQMFNNRFNVFVLLDKFQRSLGSNAADLVGVVAAEENAQVDKLHNQSERYIIPTNIENIK